MTSNEFPTVLKIETLSAAVVQRDNGVLFDITSETGQMLIAPIVGPTATLAARVLLNEFAGTDCHMADLGALLGMPGRGALLLRSLHRLQMFGFARLDGDTFGVVRHAGFRPKELNQMHPLLLDRYLAAAQHTAQHAA